MFDKLFDLAFSTLKYIAFAFVFLIWSLFIFAIGYNLIKFVKSWF